MRIIVAMVVAIVAVDLFARVNAVACDGCQRKLDDSWSKTAFWQRRVVASTPEYSRHVRAEGESVLCVGCVESSRALRQIDSLLKRGEAFREALKNAEAKVAGTIRSESAKLVRVSKDLDL